ncbi:MAG: hypothetical protein HWN67_02675 [Candidatus Helarchaeota archaeon]|nr:hypothetical protein [Candidatus Helarchaeota archaeon]
MEKETTISIIAIILGALGLVFPIFIPCFIAIILGFYAYSNDENLGLIGLILGAVGVVINALMFAGVIPWFYGII